MPMHKVNYGLLFILLSFSCFAQQHADRLSPLITNPALVQIARQNAANRITPPPPVIKVLGLPFLDDFSQPSPFPDTAKWLNGGVYTNYTYPVCPHTLGVATFDGVNVYGLPYDPHASPASSEPADTLTSMYIGLGSYSPADSLYFSFYWQAGGLGSPPKLNDSLVLEFSNGKNWTEVWYQLGYTPQPPDTTFHYVLIPVKDPQYFLNAFQFRFRSYACTAGNLDHWNIDEVYLNDFRGYQDTSQQDVSFVYESPSLIRRYEFMPWEQFTANDIKDSVFIAERNNYTQPKNTTFGYSIAGPTNSSYSGGTTNFPPFYTNGYNTNPHQAYPTVNLTYTALTGPATWNITYALNSSPDFDPWNDTLRFSQQFSNYYAYDDGTAEANYSVIPFNTYPTELAEKIYLNKTDTLVGLQMFFNYVLANASGYIFRLAVWGDSNGQPTQRPIYEDSALMSPRYGSLDEFVYYPFSVIQTVSDSFFVGFVMTSGDSVNIGFDMNNNNQYQIFYNVGYGWSYSDFPGSIMMRPLFGNRLFNAIDEINEPKEAIDIYPNPATDEVNFSKSLPNNTILRIYTTDGRLCYENLDFKGNHLETSSLPAGFYILQILPKEGSPGFSKLLISR
jgi:hypothetical protein